MSGSADLKIPTIPVTVEFALVGGSKRPVEVFVAEHMAGSIQQQRVIDVLETAPTFLPVQTAAGSQLFNKSTILWVEIGMVDGELPVEEDDGAARLYDVRHAVEVDVADGSTLEGVLLYSLPPEHARVTDYLNRDGRFLRLWTDERVLLVNKDHILCVRELHERE